MAHFSPLISILGGSSFRSTTWHSIGKGETNKESLLSQRKYGGSLNTVLMVSFLTLGSFFLFSWLVLSLSKESSLLFSSESFLRRCFFLRVENKKNPKNTPSSMMYLISSIFVSTDFGFFFWLFFRFLKNSVTTFKICWQSGGSWPVPGPPEGPATRLSSVVVFVNSVLLISFVFVARKRAKTISALFFFVYGSNLPIWLKESAWRRAGTHKGAHQRVNCSGASWSVTTQGRRRGGDETSAVRVYGTQTAASFYPSQHFDEFKLA